MSYQKVFEPAPDFEPQNQNAGGREPVFAEEANRLKFEQPGKWAKVAICQTPLAAWQMSTRVNTGRYKAFQPKRDWVATAENGSVYVKYIGDEKGNNE